MTSHPTTIGLLGGSFDPPHMGHVLLATWGLVAAGLDEVWLVPCLRHAFGKPLTDFEQRLEMCRLAVSALGPRVTVSAIERDLGESEGPNYTVDTVRALQSRHAEMRFRLLMGSDLLPEFEKWREAEQLRALAAPLVVPRLGHGPGEANSAPEALPALSSTAVRERLAAGKSLDGWIPRAVIELIRAHGLYGVSAE